jgi:hypothetical protein
MILPSVGAQTGNRFAQMIATEGRSQRSAALAMREQTLAERNRKKNLFLAMLMQRAEKRERDRANRSSDVSMMNILGGMTTGAKMGSSFGPYGTAIGAGVGGITGAFVDDEDAAEWAALNQQAQESDAMGGMGGMMGGGMMGGMTTTSQY